MTGKLAIVAYGLLVAVAPAVAGPFNKGIGSAMIYGPYTGGHGYSYNVAYSYGFPFNASDTWRRDLFAYPAGISPYRPYGRPIYHRLYPQPAVPMIAVPGDDGLPTLVTPAAAPVAQVPVLQPVPGALARPATIRIEAPAGAEVWVDKQKLPAAIGERRFTTEELTAGKMRICSVRAKWKEGNEEREQMRVVGVKAGETARVQFTAGAN